MVGENMKRLLLTVLYVIGILIVTPISIALLWIVCVSAGSSFIIGIGFVAVIVGFTLIMRNGAKRLQKERDNVFAQLRYNMPVKYNKVNILFGFCQLLSFFWLIVPFVFAITGRMWVAALPVVTVAVWVIESVIVRFWTDIGWKKYKYWLMNISAYIIGIAFGSALTVFVYR